MLLIHGTRWCSLILGGVLSLALLGTAPEGGAARGEPRRTECKTYNVFDRGISDSIKAEISQNEDTVARICARGSGEIVKYWSLSAVSKGHQGICRFWMTPVRNGERLVSHAITAMQFRPSRCPAQADTGYIFTDGISEGVFLSVVRFWRDIQSSPRVFDARLTHVDDPAQSASKKALRRHLFQGRSSGAMNIEAIEMSVLPPRAIEVRVVDSRSSEKFWLLYLDVGPSGVKVVDLVSAQF